METTNTVKNTPIVQYSDSEGNRAYAYTHWEAIDGKPEKQDYFLFSSNGTKFLLTIDDDGNIKAKKEEVDNSDEK